jgi:hypothetical protein
MRSFVFGAVAVLAWSGGARAQTVTWGENARCDEPARASNDAAAPAVREDLVARGIELRTLGRDKEALCVFVGANALREDARVLAQIGLAEAALSLWVDADRDLAEALHETDPWIERNRAALGDTAAEVGHHLASVLIRTHTTGARLRVDGAQTTATLPLSSPERVVSGPVSLELEADGYKTATRRLVLPPESLFEEAIELEALPPPARLTPKLPPVAAPRPVLEGRSAVPPPDPRRTAAWSVAGVGVAMGLAGLAAQLVAEADASTYDDDARCLYGSLTCDQRCGAWRDRADAGRALAAAGYALGGAAMVTAGALFWASAVSRGVGSAWSCGPAWGGAACSGHF